MTNQQNHMNLNKKTNKKHYIEYLYNSESSNSISLISTNHPIIMHQTFHFIIQELKEAILLMLNINIFRSLQDDDPLSTTYTNISSFSKPLQRRILMVVISFLQFITNQVFIQQYNYICRYPS